MGKRIFSFEFVVTGEIEVDDKVIDVVDDEWRSVLYDLDTPEEIIEMVASCHLRDWDLSQMDGWAGMPNDYVKLSKVDWWAKETICPQFFFAFLDKKENIHTPLDWLWNQSNERILKMIGEK